jgi:cell division protein FtsB
MPISETDWVADNAGTVWDVRDQQRVQKLERDLEQLREEVKILRAQVAEKGTSRKRKKAEAGDGK